MVWHLRIRNVLSLATPHSSPLFLIAAVNKTETPMSQRVDHLKAPQPKQADSSTVGAAASSTSSFQPQLSAPAFSETLDGQDDGDIFNISFETKPANFTATPKLPVEHKSVPERIPTPSAPISIQTKQMALPRLDEPFMGNLLGVSRW